MLLPLLEQLRVTRPAGRPHTRPDAVLGDKAYSSRAIRTHLRTRGIKTVIPEPADQQGHRKRRGSHDGRPVGLDAAAYKGPQRHRAPVRPTQAVARAGNPVRQVLHRLLTERGEVFRAGVKVAALDPFQGYKSSIDDKLEDAVAVLDAFHVVKLGTPAVDECRRRIQQETLGHRGRKGDPLYGIQNLLRAGSEKLTEKQWERFETAIAANEDAHLPVYIAWSCAQQLRSTYRHPNTGEVRKIAEQILESFPSCPIPEIARLGRTLKRWREAFLAYFDTDRSNNGGTEAVNGLIELHRRVARGFRNRHNYRLRMLLIGGGPTHPHLK